MYNLKQDKAKKRRAFFMEVVPIAPFFLNPKSIRAVRPP